MRAVLRLLLRNWPVKVMALVVSIGLWLVASSDAQRMSTYPGGVTVEYVNVPEGLVPVGAPQRVEVILAAARPAWQSFQAEQFIATVDLLGALEGVVDRDVSVRSTRTDTRVVRVTPARVLVRLEPIEQKQVTVDVEVGGEVAAGFAPGEAESQPETVVVRGPRSVLSLIDRAVARVELTGEREDVTATATVRALPEVELTAAVSFEPATVRARVPVTRASNTRTVGITVPTIGEPKRGLVVRAVEVAPVVATITGQAQLLSGLDALKTVPFSLADLSMDTTAQLPLQIPDGIRLIEPAGSTVSVTVRIGEATARRSVQVPVQVIDLPRSLRLVAVNPPTVIVNVEGPLSLLPDLPGGNLGLSLSAATLSAGENRFPLTAASFRRSEPLTVDGVEPQEVVVTLAPAQ
ncbi:MAG: YbbR-like domain-containing protein [Patescibacteria group bacterium]|jgi:YbbR domain-containing protein